MIEYQINVTDQNTVIQIYFVQIVRDKYAPQSLDRQLHDNLRIFQVENVLRKLSVLCLTVLIPYLTIFRWRIFSPNFWVPQIVNKKMAYGKYGQAECRY